MRGRRNVPIRYYDDPLRDDFSGFPPARPIRVDEHFRYIRRGPLFSLASFLLYRVIMTPLAALYCRLRFRLRLRGNVAALRRCRAGYLYGNHTQAPGDGFFPSLAAFPRRVYVVAHPDNIARRGTRTVMQMLGALPTPTTRRGLPAFRRAVAARAAHGCVAVYPEAHIWPYASVIRPFTDTSFTFPAEDGLPVFSGTVVYHATRRGKPRIELWIDGPFSGEGEGQRARRADLRNKVYDAMCRRAAQGDAVFVRYESRPDQPNHRKGAIG